ncbi:MAG: ABC transporter ATP-binding protein, partial [Roseimicrobium sp.]
MSTILRVFSYVRRYPWMAVGQLTCAILGTLLVLVFPSLTREIMDDVIPQGQMERLPGLIFIGLGAYFA